MVPKDQRFTNLTVDDTLLVRRKLIVSELELNILRAFLNIISPKATIGDIVANNINVGDVQSDSVEAKAIEITSDSQQTNVLYVPTLSSILSGQLAQFTTDVKTQITPIAVSQVTSNVLNYLFLDGSDGNVTIAAPTTLTRDMYYDTLTIDAGGVLDPGGWVIYCKTTIVNNGAVRTNGGAGGNSAGAVGGAAGAAIVSTGPMFGTTANGGGNATTDGGSSTSSFITTIGGVGGTGGNSNTNAGGTSSLDVGFFNKETVLKSINFFGLLQGNQQLGGLGGLPGMGGGGGAGGTTQGGGGGGAGGGWIAIVARRISGTGTFEAKGGDGGTGGGVDGGGGGGGGGGVVYFIAQANSILASQVFVEGGAGGTGGFQNGLAGDNGRYQVNLI